MNAAPSPPPLPSLPPLPPLLTPAPLEVEHVRKLYLLDDSAWAWHCHACWKWLQGLVKPEHLQTGCIPVAFHLLPIMKAHAKWSPQARRRQAGNYGAFDIIEIYLIEQE